MSEHQPRRTKLKQKVAVLCLFLSALVTLGSAQSEKQSVVSQATTRQMHSHDLRNDYGRWEMMKHTTGRYQLVDTKDSDWAVSVGSGGAGITDNQYPAVFIKTAGTPSCPNDFVVFPINRTPGVGSAANFGGLYNLYTGSGSSYCPNSVNQTPPTTNSQTPSVMFAYAVGSNAIASSPTLSLNGAKAAVVETGTTAKLHIMTLAKQSGSPTNFTTNAIAPPTETVLNLTATGCAGQNSTRSSVFVNYADDTAYVGAGVGHVFRIKNIFLGTPTIDYCIAVTGGGMMGTPAFDPTTGNVFVSDGTTLWALTPGATSFTVANSIALGAAGAAKQDPIIDGFGFIYVWVNNDGAGSPSSAVYQITDDLSSSTKVTLGATTTNTIFWGDFNNAYVNGGPTAANAHMYSWGYNNATTTVPTINSHNFNGTTGVFNGMLFTNNSKCEASPATASTGENMTAFFDSNTSSDQLFAGVSVGGRVCRWSPPPPNNSTAPTIVTGYTGGPGGIVVDGDSGSVVQQGSIFFGLGSTSNCGGGTAVFCIVKLKQSDLSSN